MKITAFKAISAKNGCSFNPKTVRISVLIDEKSHFLAVTNSSFSDPLCLLSYLSLSLPSCLRPVLKISFSLDTTLPSLTALIRLLQSFGINSSWVHIKYLMEMHEALGDLSESVSGKINQTRIGKIWVFEDGCQYFFCNEAAHSQYFVQIEKFNQFNPFKNPNVTQKYFLEVYFSIKFELLEAFCM